jgi:hypothetical protein
MPCWQLPNRLHYKHSKTPQYRVAFLVIIFFQFELYLGYTEKNYDSRALDIITVLSCYVLI